MEKYTKEQLNAMDKEALIQLLYNTQQLLETLVKQNQELTETIALMNQRQFGRKSEKNLVTKDQITIFDMGVNEAEVTASGQIPMEPPMETVVVQEHKRAKKKGKREEDLSRYPVTIVRHDLDDAELREKFPEGYTTLPDEVYKKLEVKPATFIVKEHHITVYKGKDGSIVKGTHPKEMLSNSIASPSLVAFIMNAKYTNAVPLYRQEQELERNDIRISRQNMAHWVITAAERYLSLLWDRLKKEITSCSVVHADETPVSVVKDGREGMHKSYMWVYRNGGLQDDHPVVLYDFQLTRKKEAPGKFLDAFTGTLVTDGYQVYHSLEKDAETQFKVAGCWAHARRKFADPVKAMGMVKAKNTVAYEALGLIQYIYQRDNELKDLKSGERKRKRKSLIRPLVNDFFRWIREVQPQVSRTSETGKALIYCLNQEKYLRVFLENPEIPMDNNAAERAIRPFCVGKKNWKLIDTIHGAEASAIIYSIVETCKLNNLNIFYYISHLLTEIPKHMDDTNLDFLEDLLPWSEKLPEECKKRIAEMK